MEIRHLQWLLSWLLLWPLQGYVILACMGSEMNSQVSDRVYLTAFC